MYQKYPDNSKLTGLMYTIKKDVYKDPKAAFRIYETYMKNNFEYDTYDKYSDLLSEAGQSDKALDVKQKLAEIFPYSPSGFYDLSKYYIPQNSTTRQKIISGRHYPYLR